MASEPENGNQIKVDNQEIARLNALHGHKTQEKLIDMGLLGRIFGSVAQTPGNVAGLVVIASFVLLACVLFWLPDNASISKKDAVSIIAGFIALGLGFLFGQRAAS